MAEFNTSQSFISSLPNFTRQGQAAVLGSAGSLSSGNANAAPSFSGSSTALTNAGQTGFQQPSPNLPRFTLNQQGNIQPPPAPGGDRNALFRQQTGGDIAPVGWQPGGPPTPDDPSTVREWVAFDQQFPNHPPFSNPDGSDSEFGYWIKAGDKFNVQRAMSEWQAVHPQPIPAPRPTPAMPPTLPQTITAPVKPVGGTAAPSVVGTGAVGQKAFGATTQAIAAGKDLQSIKGVAPVPMPVPTPIQTPTNVTFPSIPNFLKGMIGFPGLINIFDIFQSRGAQIPQTSKSTKEPFPTPTPTQEWNPFTKTYREKPIAPVPTPTLTPEAENQRQEQIRETWNKFAGLNTQELFNPKAIITSELTDGKLTQAPVTAPEQKFPAMTQILPPEQHGQAIQLYISGQAPKDEVVSAIASPEAKATVQKMIATAAKAGDMLAVSKLAELPPAIDQTIQFINMIGRAVLATSQGFGTPNAPGVTETRMPMVQQGVGQALTSPRPDFSQSPISGQSAQMIPYLRPRFDEVQQNRPPIFPYFNGR